MDPGMSVLDHLLEQAFQTIGSSSPRESLREQPAPAAHLLRQLRVREQATDPFRIFSGIVAIDEVTAHIVTHDRAEA